MCIRDRFIGQMDDEVKNAVFGNVGTIMTLRLGVTDANFMPVSYTHLRAHETVLDLVCRLLLEKKKNSTQSDVSGSVRRIYISN